MFGFEGLSARRLCWGDRGDIRAGLQDPAQPEAAHCLLGDRQEAVPDTEAWDDHRRDIQTESLVSLQFAFKSTEDTNIILLSSIMFIVFKDFAKHIYKLQ